MAAHCQDANPAPHESVCASLWNVPSYATMQLTTQFFQNLKRSEWSREEALRQAQLSVLRDGVGQDGRKADFSHPHCWAAFVILGEYR